MKWQLKRDKTGHPYLQSECGKHFIAKALIKTSVRYTVFLHEQPPKSFDTREDALAWCDQAVKG